MNRKEEIKNHPMLENVKNNLKMRGIFISETDIYSYEDEIKALEDRKIESQEFLDYLSENDTLNKEVEMIELAQKAINEATEFGSLGGDIMESLTETLNRETRTHNTTIRMKSRSEAIIAAADREIQKLKEEKSNALGLSDEDILFFFIRIYSLSH